MYLMSTLVLLSFKVFYVLNAEFYTYFQDVVIRGGENIYPTEIEQFLYKHPKVQDVQV